jgi:Ca-activated chloride channel family protein
MHRRRAPQSSRLTVVVVFLLGCMIAGPGAATAGSTDTGPDAAASEWDPARPGPGELLSRDGDHLVPLPLVGMQVDLEVTGILVHGNVSQAFRNDRADVLEATYVFPLPEGAAVNALEMRVGDRRIVATVKERDEARQIYEQARDEGRKAALLEQGRPNLFRASVAAINPGETVEVRLGFVEQAAYADGEFSLSFPLVYTPRYLPAGATAGGDTPCDRANTDCTALTLVLPRAGVRVRLDVGLPLASVDSPSHRIALERRTTSAVVTLAGGPAQADRDFVLRWRIRRSTEPQAALFVEDRDDGRYALAMILPPAPEPAAEADAGLSTETLFIVDVSGSMDGPSIEQARRALTAALSKLRPDDTFNLLKFNDRYEPFREAFLPADAESVAAAVAWIEDLRATGGTEILPALLHGLQMMKGGDDRRVRRLVFLTDGAVANEEQVLAEVAARHGEERLHVIGIGHAPNRYLMRKLASLGRGRCEFLPDGDELGPRLEAFLARIDRPVISDLDLVWDGAPPLEAYPAKLPDLHAGEPVFVSLRLGLSHPGLRAMLRGWQGDHPAEVAVEVGDGATAGAGVADRWARAKVEALFDSLRDGGDPAAVRAEVLAVATEFRLATPYTSLVAVEEMPTAEGASRRVNLAAALASGGDLPSGGTDGPLRLWIGLALCATAAALWPIARARR